MNSKPNDSIHIPLLENGLDFIRSALDHFAGEPSDSDLKYGVLHLCAGLELILKQRLLQEHWTLIFENVDRANRTNFETGEFNSVSFDTCIQRLINVAGIHSIVKVQDDLKRFRRRRNRIEHFGITDSVEAIKASASKVLGIVIDFIRDEFSEDDLLGYEDSIDEIRGCLRDFERFVKHRMQEVSLDMEGSFIELVECSRCLQKAVLRDDGIECLFCGHRNPDSEDAANEYVSAIMHEDMYSVVKDGGEWPVYNCYECGAEALVRTNDGHFYCFSCSESWDSESMGFCDSCGLPFVSHEGEVVCRSCIEQRMLD